MLLLKVDLVFKLLCIGSFIKYLVDSNFRDRENKKKADKRKCVKAKNEKKKKNVNKESKLHNFRVQKQFKTPFFISDPSIYDE